MAHPRLLPLVAVLTACAPSQADRASSTPEPAQSNTPEHEPFVPKSLSSDLDANVPVLPWGLTSLGSVVHDGTLYVLGGYSGQPHAYSAADQHGELLAYDLARGQWSVVSKVPAVQGASLVSHASGLLRVGGMRALNPTTATPSELVSIDVVQRFDAVAGAWVDLPSLPEGRSSHEAVVVEDSLYVVGGWTLNHDARGGKWPAEMFVLDLADPQATWSTKPAPFARRAIGAAAAGGKLIAVGGMGADRKLSKGVEIYDPRSDTWSKANDYPGQGFGVAAVGRGDEVFASGSDGGVHRLDVNDGTWSRVGSLAWPRFFHRMVVEPNGNVWALGGIRPNASAERTRIFEAVVGERAAEPVVVRLQSPMPSKNRQGSAVHGDGVYFFGGNNSLGQHDFAAENFTSAGYRLDLSTFAWTEVAAYPKARQTMSVSTSGAQIVAVGGFGHDGQAAKSHPEAYVYSVSDDAWTEVEGLPGPRGRTQFGLAHARDRWWVFGGLDYDPSRSKGDQFRHETAILSGSSRLDEGFEPSGAALSEPRRAFAGAAFDEHYVVVGGMREGFELVDTCEAFAFETQTWAPFPCPSKPRLSGHLVALADTIVLVAGSTKGGDGKLEPDHRIEIFNPMTRTWSVAPTLLPIEPKHVHVHGWGDALVAMSAHNDNGQIEVVVSPPGALGL